MSAASILSLTRDGHVAVLTLNHPPHNFITRDILADLADRLAVLDTDPACRAVVLRADGRSFSAGADFSSSQGGAPPSAATVGPIYEQALRLFSFGKPIIAAVEGPAVGAGLGLALVADFRVACPEARFVAAFNRLGFHPGFGLSLTLPRLIGHQRAALLLYTGRRIGGEEAQAMGMVDVLVAKDQVRSEAMALATEIAGSAPLAVVSTRATLRRDLLAELHAAVAHECEEQHHHYQSADFQEGVAAMAARRPPEFKGR
jgi:enoyl-CoA hydratase/carnithine racemase